MMKKYFLFLLAAIIFISCNVNRKDKISDDNLRQYQKLLKDSTTVEVIDSVYNFGKITDGEKVEYKYRFKNTGAKPLVITNATASCGCTVPERPEKPILPGETGFIKVVFDSKGKGGGITRKTITVTSNANPAFQPLVLTGDVTKE